MKQLIWKDVKRELFVKAMRGLREMSAGARIGSGNWTEFLNGFEYDNQSPGRHASNAYTILKGEKTLLWYHTSSCRNVVFIDDDVHGDFPESEILRELLDNALDTKSNVVKDSFFSGFRLDGFQRPFEAIQHAMPAHYGPPEVSGYKIIARAK